MQERLASVLGIVVILALSYALCPRASRSFVRLRTIGGGLVLLFVLAALVLRTPVRGLFGWASAVVDRLLEFSRAGSSFVFGALAENSSSFGFVFAFQVLPTIIFFSALMAVAYHIGVMPFVVRQLGRFISRVLGVSAVESLSTVADIFVGQTEAPLVIRPYLPRLTRSELMACMTAGFATTAGGVLAAYVLMLQGHVPEIAGHLIACSVMSAPASLVLSKLMLPESDVVEQTDPSRLALPRTSSNIIDAITTGTVDGVRLAVNVGAMIVAFLALTALVDFCLGRVSGLVLSEPLTLQRVFGFVFAPLAWLMGVPLRDVPQVASLLGQKTVMNEFVAYSTMANELTRDPTWLTERGRLIASYALCGFANFGSIGIQVGGYASLAPDRRVDLTELGPRAMLAGLLTTCLVACVAGLFG